MTCKAFYLCFSIFVDCEHFTFFNPYHILLLTIQIENNSISLFSFLFFFRNFCFCFFDRWRTNELICCPSPDSDKTLATITLDCSVCTCCPTVSVRVCVWVYVRVCRENKCVDKTWRNFIQHLLPLKRIESSIRYNFVGFLTARGRPSRRPNA